MTVKRVLVLGKSHFFRKVAGHVAESGMADVHCYPAEDAIDAFLKINEGKPHTLIADVDSSASWGVDFVHFVTHHLPEIGVVAVSESPEVLLPSVTLGMVVLRPNWGPEHLQQAFETLSRREASERDAPPDDDFASTVRPKTGCS